MAMPEGAKDQTRKALATIEKVLGKVFGEIAPAATLVIAGLCEPEMKIEIDATAYRPH